MARKMLFPIDDKGFPFEILKNDKLPDDILNRILPQTRTSIDDYMMKHMSTEKMGTWKEKDGSRYSIYLPDNSLGCFVYGKGGFAILFGTEFTHRKKDGEGIGRGASSHIAVYSYSVMSRYKLQPDNFICGGYFNLDDDGNLLPEEKKDAKHDIAKLRTWMKKFYNLLKEEDLYTHTVYKFVRQAQFNGI